VTAAGDVAGWWWLAVRVCAADLWQWLPGPWPVKVLLLAILAAGQYIPGELDELLFIAAIAAAKRLTARGGSGPAVSTWPIVLT
jgi:hypothetical protein